MTLPLTCESCRHWPAEAREDVAKQRALNQIPSGEAPCEELVKDTSMDIHVRHDFSCPSYTPTQEAPQ